MRNVTKLFNVLFKMAFIISVCFTGGCSTISLPPQHLKVLAHSDITKQIPLKNFKTIGKIGFSDGETGGHARIQWEQYKENYRIRLFGPLGSGSIQIVGNKKGVQVIRDDGKVIRAKNPETLVAREFGWIIPVLGLRYWLQGIPAPGAPPSQIRLDDKNRIWQINQQGWIVRYQAYQEVDGFSIPYKLFLQHGAIQLKFIFQHWDFVKS